MCFFLLSERFSGWCLCCCPLWCGSSRFRSVIRTARRSRKVSSSSAWCCPSCCRKPFASLTTSCWSESLRVHSCLMVSHTVVLNTVSNITLTESFWLSSDFHHILHCRVVFFGINLLAETINLIFSTFWQQWIFTACVKMPVKSWLGRSNNCCVPSAYYIHTIQQPLEATEAL